MANSQDATDPNIYGMQADGSQSTAWGSNAGKHWQDYYGAGFSPDNGLDPGGDPSEIPRPNDVPGVASAQTEAQKYSGRALDVARYRSMGEAAAARDAPFLQYARAYQNLNRGDGYLDEAESARLLGRRDRATQLSALALQRQAAEGSAPSQAQLLGRNMLDQGLQAQLAGAASARGGAMAQAAAMRQAQQGAAAYHQQGANSLAALRAQEMATARDAYQQGASNIRSLDYTGAHQATEAAQQSNAMALTNAQMAQYRADLELRNRSANDQSQQYYEGMGFNVNQAALNAAMGMSSSLVQQNQFNQQMDLAQQQRTDAMTAAGLSAGATLGAGALTRRASGGPVSTGQPVLVGERGPEVIVPSQPGTVLPATHPTSQAAARSSMTMADVARLRQQADHIERGLARQRLAGPSVKALPPKMISVAPVIIGGSDDGIEDERAGMSRPGPDMSTQPKERLWGGREDPYTADPYYVPLDHAAPTWGGLLSGGREDPYAAPTMASVASRRETPYESGSEPMRRAG